MAQTCTYTQSAARLNKLHDELVAAGITPVRVEGSPPPYGPDNVIRITVADGVSPAAVDAVLAAHDPATPSAGEQQAAQDTADLADYADEYTSMLQQAAAGRAAVGAAQTANASDLTTANSAAWDALSGAQRSAAVRRLLQREAEALHREEALYAALTRLLTGLWLVLRRQGGV